MRRNASSRAFLPHKNLQYCFCQNSSSMSADSQDLSFQLCVHDGYHCCRAAEVRGCCAAAQALAGSLPCWNAGSHASSSVQQVHQQDLLLLSPFQGFAAHYAKGKGK